MVNITTLPHKHNVLSLTLSEQNIYPECVLFYVSILIELSKGVKYQCECWLLRFTIRIEIRTQMYYYCALCPQSQRKLHLNRFLLV
jgi:hypothetical protein